MRTLGLIRTATLSPRRDLWPRIATRLREDEPVRLRVPALGWFEATAVATVVGTLVLLPDPVRFLTACGLL